MDHGTPVVRMLATIVAQPGTHARRIDADNKSPGTCTLAKALASGGAFAVRVRADIVAVDFDADTAHKDARTFVGYVRAHGLDPVVLASGTPGRNHVFTRVTDENMRRLVVKEARRVHGDVRQANNLIRPPCSPHRHGGRSELLDPLDPLDAADLLLGPLDNVPARYHRLLRFGDVGKEFRSRSECDQAIIAAAVLAGWTTKQLLDAFLNPRNIGGERVQELDHQRRRGAEGYLDICVRKVAKVQLARIQSALDATPWPGQAGGTDRAVLQALVNIATTACTVTPDASYRRLADTAGVRRQTVERALARLITKGWLVVDRPGRGREGTRWRFGPASRGGATYAVRGQGGCVNVTQPRDILGHDAFRYQGLGKGVQQTLALLWRGPATVAALMAATGYRRGTIWRHLKVLQNEGLIARDEKNRYRALEDVDFDALAVQLDVVGIGERQRVKHQQQRETYVEYLARPRWFPRWEPSAEIRAALHRNQRYVDRINQRRAL
jgi:DNA-binding MarR family transcriptional regulator